MLQLTVVRDLFGFEGFFACCGPVRKKVGPNLSVIAALLSNCAKNGSERCSQKGFILNLDLTVFFHPNYSNCGSNST